MHSVIPSRQDNPQPIGQPTKRHVKLDLHLYVVKLDVTDNSHCIMSTASSETDIMNFNELVQVIQMWKSNL